MNKRAEMLMRPAFSRSVRYRWITVLALGFASAAWAGSKSPTPPTTEPPPELLQASRTTAKTLATRLKSTLQTILPKEGPAKAVSACNELAPQITTQISLAEGWRVTRVSLKQRNALLGSPDAWEQQILLDFERRHSAGEDPSTLEHATVVQEPQGEYFRYMKAIPTEGVCLVCHGPADTLGPEIKAQLNRHYPADRATGYQPGDIRGAVSVKIPLD